ncbi:MAG TPA: gliding motility protein GldN [Chitinophagales bacterium]|nr:gliding motility protein GldN [Chitinophagales bacterium]HRK27125.1 gliding motility protein GldN [Chitinophagales bacterium]
MKPLLKFLLVLFLPVIVAQRGEAQNNESYDNTNKPPQTEETPQTNVPGGSGGSSPEVRDGAYDRNIAKERRPLPYAPLREADIFWEKRVWRVIDTRQKMNQPFNYPSKPFINILLEVVRNNKNDVPIYLDDEFKQRILIDDLDKRLGSLDTIQVYDPDKDEYITKVVKNDFNWTTVNFFRIKEDWIFDEQSSTMLVRIIGIAPIRDVIDDNGNYRGQEAMFWAYYPSLRNYLVKYDAFSPFNNAMSLSWDDIFEMRRFASHIIKASNIHDRRISDYAAGRDALLEAENIKKQIMEFEHNLWSY